MDAVASAEKRGVMHKLIVFWMLVVIGIAMVGLLVSNFIGDKMYDKAKRMAKSYLKEDIEEKEEKETRE